MMTVRPVVSPLFVVLVIVAGCAIPGDSPSNASRRYGAEGDQPGDSISPQRLGSFDFSKIVFVKRKPYSSDHYYTDINNGTAPDRFLPENGIYVYDLQTQQERPVVTAAKLPGGKGFIGKISLAFDATKVLFDFRENPHSGFRIWEVKLDGTGLRQVSYPPPDEAEKVTRWGKPWHTDDIHPAYLSDGGIVFSSTRCEHTILCGGSAVLVAPVLHRMDADGSNVRQLSQSPVSEFCPLQLDDGRVMYHRWEYIDKGARVCKTIWTMGPDGSKPRELYGGNDDTTTVYMYPQPMPGNAHRLVCVGTCHFPQGGCLGAVMMIDLQSEILSRGPDPDEPGFQADDTVFAVRNITPSVFVERRTEPGWFFRGEDGRYTHDQGGQSGHLYTHPYPIAEDRFLVSYKEDPQDHYQDVADAYALYAIDLEGTHTLIHRDDALSCWHPTPVKRKSTPALLTASHDPTLADADEALCIVDDIYAGMEGVERGEVRWLRINEAVPRYWDTGRRWSEATSSSSWKAALWPRVQWGVVPVEKDGSAHFKVPSNRNLFFQALDKDFREVQRERTYVNYKPGEVRSCVGCHRPGSRTSALTLDGTRLALRRPPSLPQPQPCDLAENGGDGSARQVIHYPSDIQPIFDAHCVSCHGNDQPDGDLTLTGELTVYYSRSYEQLCEKELAGPLISEFTSFNRGDQGNYNGATLPPKSLGAHRSLLLEILTNPAHEGNQVEDHSRLLDANQLMVLSRWVDSNYQFYGGYYGRHHSAWVNPDPAKPAYAPADFRRRPSFEEAVSNRAPAWHR